MIKQLGLEKWQDFASSQDNFQIFHHKNWLQLLADQYGFGLKIFAVEADGTVKAAIPFLQTRTITAKKKLVCLPFSDYLNVLYNNEDYLTEMLDFLKQDVNKQFGHIEIRGDLSEQDLYHEDLFVLHHLDLDRDYDTVFQNFKDSLKRNIRKAEKNNIRIENSVSEKAVETFYKLHLQTRKKHGAPIQPKGYFYRLKKYLFDEKLGFISTAYLEDLPIAACIFLYVNQKLFYKYGASDEKYLSYRPNELIFSEVIRWGCDKQFSSLDFGISFLYNEGLRRYKSNWGTKEIVAPYYFITPQVPRKPLIRGENKYLKWVVRNSPLWLCRILGESLYRFAG